MEIDTFEFLKYIATLQFVHLQVYFIMYILVLFRPQYEALDMLKMLILTPWGACARHTPLDPPMELPG